MVRTRAILEIFAEQQGHANVARLLDSYAEALRVATNMDPTAIAIRIDQISLKKGSGRPRRKV